MARGARVMAVASVASLSLGGALLAHILAGASLRVGAAFALMVVVGALTAAVFRAPVEARPRVVAAIRRGAAFGFIATIVYDVTKAFLSRLDPQRYHPFEAVLVFGQLLLGTDHSRLALLFAGSVFHLANGCTFGIAFSLLFRRPGVLVGIAWGLFLETFQLAFYPRWLGIRFVSEFIAFSALGHVVYGAVLGLGCRASVARQSGAS